eukprot:CAMPEP_0168612328 /NCGR_PEP_ID=MMETSP0449_2-20121227/2857_1 /TAXON_ID=1082188 /ORGANISM="Strombidium rassoulzadegani, Strain ras09" /LENGTH=105 /DNA_ID=CAMNT_0008652883 /DNA_START=248 /DNA_END=562 /DNA_ORIENTATION=+
MNRQRMKRKFASKNRLMQGRNDRMPRQSVHNKMRELLQDHLSVFKSSPDNPFVKSRERAKDSPKLNSGRSESQGKSIRFGQDPLPPTNNRFQKTHYAGGMPRGSQ